MATPRAYERLQVDERRRRLLELGTDLFTQHSYDELSMARIARAGGISKALLYHYFPSKQAFFVATVQAAITDVQAAIDPDPSLPPAAQLDATLDAYLRWIEANAVAYGKLLRSAQAAAEVRAVVDRVRSETTDRIVAGLGPAESPPGLRTAVAGWLWCIDGACLDWIEHGAIDRDQLKRLLLGALGGAIAGAGVSTP